MPRPPTIEALRLHPRERFRGSERVIDLARVARDLRSGTAPSSSGHRQIVVHRRGPTTVALFVFEAGGELKKHRVEGLTCVHVLRGAIEVHTPSEPHALHGGQMLMLDPGVAHDVKAGIASEVLLTFQIDRRSRVASASH